MAKCGNGPAPPTIPIPASRPLKARPRNITASSWSARSCCAAAQAPRRPAMCGPLIGTSSRRRRAGSSLESAWRRTVDGLAAGLAMTPKEIPCKYFYDAAGSRLFERICELPEYYQTRTEMALLRRHAVEIATLMGDNVELLEFGAGSLRKVRILLDAAQNISAYTPLDISGDYLGEGMRSLA